MSFGEHEKIGRSCFFLCWKRRTTSATFLGSISAKLSTNTWPGGGSRQMVSHSRKVSIRGRISQKTSFSGYFTVPYLWPGYGSRETFCDAYTVSIPWRTSHTYALPRWLLLRDVPFSSYPRPKVFLCHGISNGENWMPIFISNILARGATIGSPICTGTLHQYTVSSLTWNNFKQTGSFWLLKLTT